MDNTCEFASDCTVRNRRRLGQRLVKDPKRKGELAELAFIQKAADLGLMVSKPCGDSFPYDLIVQSGGRLLRIQVKSCFTSKRRGYSVNLGKRTDRTTTRYTENEIDFLAVYIVPHDVWYVIPVQAAQASTQLRFYPVPSRRKGSGQYEAFRETWHLISGVPAPAPEPVSTA